MASIVCDFLYDRNTGGHGAGGRRVSFVFAHYNYQGTAAEATAVRLNTCQGRDRITSKLYVDNLLQSKNMQIPTVQANMESVTGVMTAVL